MASSVVTVAQKKTLGGKIRRLTTEDLYGVAVLFDSYANAATGRPNAATGRPNDTHPLRIAISKKDQSELFAITFRNKMFILQRHPNRIVLFTAPASQELGGVFGSREKGVRMIGELRTATNAKRGRVADALEELREPRNRVKAESSGEWRRGTAAGSQSLESLLAELESPASAPPFGGVAGQKQTLTPQYTTGPITPARGADLPEVVLRRVDSTQSTATDATDVQYDQLLPTETTEPPPPPPAGPPPNATKTVSKAAMRFLGMFEPPKLNWDL